MKNLLILAFALALGGCYQKTVNGELSVYETFQLKKGKKVISVEPNEYSAKLILNDKKKFQLVIPGVKGKKFTFKFPRQFDVPRTNGTLKLNARDLNQPVDIELNFNTSTSRSSVETTVEQCSRTYYDRVCRMERVPGRRVCHTDSHGNRVCRNEPPRTRRVCQSIPRTIYGDRDVTFRTVDTETTYVAEIFKPSSTNLVANFNSREFRSHREVLNTTACRINYPRFGRL